MQNLARSVLDRWAEAPDRAAIIEADGTAWSRGALRRAVNGLAHRLGQDGLSAGERVVIQIPPGPALITATLAVIALGAVPVLLEGGLGDDLYLGRVAAAEPGWRIVHPALALLDRLRPLRRPAARLGIPPLPPAARHVGLSTRDLRAIIRDDPGHGFMPTPVGDDAPCIIVYTGGTTQAPKGVAHTHGSLRAFLGGVGHLGGLQGVERMAVDTLPQALYALHLGLEAHLAAGRGARRARSVLAALQDGRAQGYFGAPYLWREMMRLAPGQRLPESVRWVLLGSAPVRPRFLQELQGFLHPGTAVWSLYGMTEAGPICAAGLDEKLAWTGEGDLVGRPVPGVRVEVDAPPGEVGEVLVTGPSVCPGYLGQPTRPPGSPLRTGDLGQWIDQPGGPVLALHGRLKEMVIRRGVNIYPGTLEGPILQALLRRGLPVEDCALLGAWQEHDQDESLILAVVGPPSLDAGAVMEIARNAAGPDGAPDRIVRIDAMPVKGRQNKRDLAALRDLVRAQASSVPAPSDHSLILPFGAADLLQRSRVRLRAGGGTHRVIGEIALRLGLWGVSQATWALDALAAPRWAEATGRGPLFIIGHQRSGTTALHRLLAADHRHARALTLAEMLLPAITAAPLLRGVARLDRLLGGALSALEDRIFSPTDALHRIRMGEVEEDEFVLWAVFSSIMVANDDPYLVEHRHLDHLRRFEEWPALRRRRVLAFYRDALIRRLYRDRDTDPQQRWIVAKNPAFTQKIPELSAMFPDARFIYLIRHPVEAIRSRLSLLRAIWHRRFPGSPDLTEAQTAVIVEDSLRTYRAAERDLPDLPAHRRLILPHRELHADPDAAVRRIYDHFQLPGPPPPAPPPPPPRSLTAADIRLDEAAIRAALADVFARYGF